MTTFSFNPDVSEETKRKNPHIYPPQKQIESNAAVFDDAVSQGEEVASLHVPFILWLRSEGYLYIHTNPRAKSTIAVGWPDFSVFTPHGVRLVEFKAKGGRVSPEQLGVKAKLELLGFSVLVTKSLKEAQAFTKGEQQP